MNSLEVALRRIAQNLDDRGRRWALVGGLAVSARAEPRTTRDVDVVVEIADDADAEALVLDLQASGFRVVAALEQDSVHRLATVRLVTPGGDARGVVVDLLFASSGIEVEVARSADTIELLAGLRIPVARVGHLMALKLLARDDRRRPQDADDLRSLLKEATTGDLTEARDALSAIAARGYHRGRDLVEALETFLREENGFHEEKG
jgi:predicted nucleotidyltransferase